MDFKTCNELRRKKRCFTCKEPWTLDHRFLGKGKIDYVGVLSEEEDDQHMGSDEEENEDRPPRGRKKVPRGSLIP